MIFFLGKNKTKNVSNLKTRRAQIKAENPAVANVTFTVPTSNRPYFHGGSSLLGPFDMLPVKFKNSTFGILEAGVMVQPVSSFAYFSLSVSLSLSYPLTPRCSTVALFCSTVDLL